MTLQSVQAVTERYIIINGEKVTCNVNEKELAQIVAREFNIKIEQLKQVKTREFPYSNARAMYAWLLRNLLGYKWEYIGLLLKTNYVNVNRTQLRFEKQLKSDVYMFSKLKAIIEQL
jgi:chromosomal replication initiation ATPase DnaA